MTAESHDRMQQMARLYTFDFDDSSELCFILRISRKMREKQSGL
jgi:hypothetical protein